MQVTLLGTGSALPSPERVQSGTLVEGQDRRLLIDCGSGVVHRLSQAGYASCQIDTVLLTHLHLDHIADLPTLLKARILSNCPSLTVVGPPGTRAVCNHLFAVDDLSERAEVTVIEQCNTDEPFQIVDFSIELVETVHSKQSFAYRFGDQFVVSGDTAPAQRVFELADGVHTLIHECAYTDAIETATHTTPSGILAGLDAIAVDRVVLTHLFPQAEERVNEIRSAVRSVRETEVLIATDGMALGFPN